MIKLLFWIGTRPEAIKLAPVIVAAKNSSSFEVEVVCSGQHSEMAVEALQEFEIEPDFAFKKLEPQSLAESLAELVQRASRTLSRESFDWMIVHGDTLTTLAGALASFMLKVRVAHVEAGLRSFNLEEPFPEEGNRAIVSRIASLNFAPTDLSVSNLTKEGIPKSKVFRVGNTIVDSVRLVEKSFTGQRELRDLVMVTAHRRENWHHLAELSEAVKMLAKAFPNLTFVLPLHPNPVVRGSFSGLSGLSNVEVTAPLRYRKFLETLSSARLVITDSGGIQEEVVSLGTNCLVLRGVTERPEVLDTGLVSLVEMNSKEIYTAAARALVVEPERERPQNPFGDGFASERILSLLAQELD
jgi:UDP-N-acetylglucosamine 2-epimerase (non-hydrolysing)